MKPPSSNYAVQLASFERKEEAEQYIKDKQTPQLSLYLAEVAGASKVLYGRFLYGAEAQIWKRHFRNQTEFADAFVVTIPHDGLAPDGTLPSVFGTQGATAANLSLQTMSGDVRYESLERLDFPGNEATYRKELEAALTKTSQGEALQGYIMANLGILDLKQGPDYYQSALNRLVPVARGEVPASASVRVMAMSRASWLIHHMGDRERALCAWRETRQFSNSESVKERCWTEEVGLLKELADSGKGTFEEVRREASLAYSNTNPANLKQRILLEMMYVETFAKGSYPINPNAAKLMEAIVNKYASLNTGGKLDREIFASMFMVGLFKERSGDTDGAIDWYGKVLKEVPSDAPIFAGVNLHAESLAGLARTAEMAGNRELQHELRLEVLINYPDSHIAQKIARNVPGLAETARLQREADQEQGDRPQ